MVFGVIEDISLVGYIIRTFIVGIVAFLVGRYVLKRTVAQLTAYDFVLVWTLGALTVAPLLDGKVSFTYIVVPLLTLFFGIIYSVLYLLKIEHYLCFLMVNQ